MTRIKYPPMIQWEVTPFCNHNCIHCYNYWRTSNDKEGDLVFNKSVSESYYFDIANKIVALKPISVVITGGEPFSVLNMLFSSIELFIKNGIHVSINTNATMYTEEIVSFLKKWNIGLFISLPCSDASICDEITGRKNSLKQISDSIRYLVRQNISVATNMVVSKLNLNCIYSTAEYAKDILGVHSFYATRVAPPVNDKEFELYILSISDIHFLTKTLLEINQKLGLNVSSAAPYCLCGLDTIESVEMFGYDKNCTAGKTSFALSPEGGIKACIRDSEIYGNIFEDSFDEVMNKMEKWRDGSLIPIECKECSDLYLCGGGCRLDSFPITGRLDRLDLSAEISNRKQTKRKTINYEVVSPEAVYKLIDGHRFVQEKEGYRLNCGRQFTYVTDKFHDFFVDYKYFNIFDIKEFFGTPELTAKQVIYSLLSRKIIERRE